MTTPDKPIDTQFNVPVRVWVPQHVFKAVHARYGERTPEFLSRVVVRSLTGKPKARNIDPKPRKPRVRRTPELEGQVLEMHAAGTYSVLIAARLELSEATVSRILAQHDLKPNGSWRR